MTWEHFYDNYLEWADSTISSRISQITDIQNAKTSELVDCCGCIDEILSCRLLRRAIKAQISFSYAEIAEITLFVSDGELLNDLVMEATGSCTQKNLEDLNDSGLPEELIFIIAKHYGLHIPNEGAIWQPGVLQKQIDELAESVDHLTDNLNQINKNLGRRKHQKKSGLLALLGVLGESNHSNDLVRFKIGDHVRVKYRGQEGTIVDINGKLIMVSLDDGKYVDSYDESQLEKAW